jgi:hypothetical protein
MIDYRDLVWGDRDHTFFKGEVDSGELGYGWIPYNFYEGDTGIGAELWPIRDTLEIAEWTDPRDLEKTRAAKIDEINAAKNHQLDTGGLEYMEDLFAYDDKALLRISGTILDWQDQISRGTVKPEDIIQPWISKANRVHPLSYDQLIELARLLRQEVQRIVFYGTYLEKLAQAATTLEELDAIVWDYGAASASGIIDRLIAGGNQDA